MLFNVYEWTPYVADLETCYRFEEKGSNIDKGENEGGLINMRVSLAPDMPLAWTVKIMKERKRWMGGNPSIIINFFCFCRIYFMLVVKVNKKN